MGLDQYIESRAKSSTDVGDWEEVCYFRKVNFLHRWFITHYNLDEGFNTEHPPCYLDKDSIKQVLASTCKVYVAYLEGPPSKFRKLADKLLPTQAGFLFGSTDYDDYYAEDLAYTIEQLITLLRKWDDNKDYVYTCWW